MCLKFPEFEAGCAYKLITYKKETCTQDRDQGRVGEGGVSNTMQHFTHDKI